MRRAKLVSPDYGTVPALVEAQASSMRRGGSRVSTEKLDTLIYGVPAEWARACACRRGEIWQHVCLVGVDAGSVLGGAWQADRLDQAVHEGEEYVLRARQGLDQMVRGRHHECGDELHRSASCRACQPGRDHLGGRRSRRIQAYHLRAVARSGLPLRQRPEKSRCEEGRHGHDLSAHDPGSRLRHAGLRADRGGAFHRVRRLLAGRAGRAHRGLQVQGRHHRR